MSEKERIGHIPGPWQFMVGDYVREESTGIVICEIRKRGISESEAHGNLIEAAPAMKLALDLICAGRARIERTGKLMEFCFDGIRYCMNGDWNALISVVGWDKARAAIAKAHP